MHNFLKRICRVLRISTFLVVVAVTACAPALAATPRITVSMTPTVTLSPAPSSPPLDSPTQTHAPPTSTPTSIARMAVTIDYIQMMDEITGWGTGQVGSEETTRLLHTTDSGVTWRDVSSGLKYLHGFFFLDAQLAWMSDGGELWHTSDGGQSWTSLGQASGSDIWFNDSQHGWKMHAEQWGLTFAQFDIYSFAITQDGGKTWQETNPPPGKGLVFLAFPDEQMAWILRAGFANVIEGVPNLGVPFSLETTTDGGKTWQSQEMSLPPGTEVVEMYDGIPLLAEGNCDFDSPVYSSTTLWKLALMCEEKGWLYTTTDQGKTWTINSLPDGQVTDVQFITATMGWSLQREKFASFQSQLYQTTDGGQTWIPLTQTNWADAQLNFLNDQTGWAVVVTCEDVDCNPYFYPKVLVNTTDGGKTWLEIQPQVIP